MRQETKNGMNHPNEQTLTLYILKAPEVEPRRRQIASHLKKCKGCSALHDEISNYYKEFFAISEEQKSQALSMMLTERSLQPFLFKQGVQAPPRRTIPQRFAESFRAYPARWSAGFLTVVAALVLLTEKITTKDVNPAYARAKDEFLIAYNKTGDELWRKHIGFGYDFDAGSHKPPPEIHHNYLETIDVDGDGANEVLALFGWLPKPLAVKENTLICYRSDGSERWKHELHRQMTFGSEKFSDDYHFGKMMVGDFDRDGKMEVIGVATHSPYYPTAILRLDAQTGTLQSEYWHSGLTAEVFHADLDGDGVEEIITGGTNNSFNQAAMVIFDPRSISGHAPASSAYIPVGIAAGREKYYVLFPTTDLFSIGSEKRNRVTSIRSTSDNLLEVRVLESIRFNQVPQEIHYYFDAEMRCVRVTGNDYFDDAHRKLEAAGKLTKKLNEQYYEELRQGVRYWDGAEFVKEPAINEKYKILSKK